MSTLSTHDLSNPSRGRATRRHVLIVGLAALIMALPTLPGTFVGGDDFQLALEHVLVNHPSLEHAVKLFEVVHRDLYQPIPLLTFSLEFALAQSFGLFDRSIEGGAWVFHLTNILLHVANSVLVFLVIHRLQSLVIDTQKSGTDQPATPLSIDSSASDYSSISAPWIGAAAGILFALHPLNVEVIAWINGRMMALSTLFALASMLTLYRWLRAGRWHWFAFTVLFVALCMMSKVRVGIPALFLILAFAGRYLKSARFWSVWIIASILTAVFVWINMSATTGSGGFDITGRVLQGPRLIRVLMALAWYFQHLAIPTGLCAWYPTPFTVTWTHLLAPEVSIPLLCAGAFFAWACRKSRSAVLGLTWFFTTIVDTLPILPARNSLAADRYMYLSIVGLCWLIGTVAWPRLATVEWRKKIAKRQRIPQVLIWTVLIALTAQSWYVGSFYLDGIRKRKRIATLYPTTPEVWVRVAWTHYIVAMAAKQSGEIEKRDFHLQKAAEFANRELENAGASGHAEALTVLGLTQLRLGNTDEALRILYQAVSVNLDNGEPKGYLGFVLEEIGRLEEALPYYEGAAARLPLHIPTLMRLARAYHKLGRPDDARDFYNRSLAINAYETTATCGLAQLEIEQNTPEGFKAAEKRLRDVLRWMPENIEARTALGVALNGQNRVQEAVSEYKQILTQEPNAVTAALNLAQILFAQGNVQAARPYFLNAAQQGPESFEQAIAVHDFFIHTREPNVAVESWKAFGFRFPFSQKGLVMYAWSHALTGNTVEADRLLKSLSTEDQKLPLTIAATCYVSLIAKRYAQSVESVHRLIDMGTVTFRERQRLLKSLEGYDEQNPGDPWTYCITADLLQADHQTEACNAFLKLCDDLCRDDSCRAYLQQIRAYIPSHRSDSEPPPPQIP